MQAPWGPLIFAPARTRQGVRVTNPRRTRKFLMKAGLVAAAAAIALIGAAPAQAAKGTYAGTVTNTAGHVAFDVKISRLGVVTKVTRLRGKDIPSNCEQSGQIPDVNFDLAAKLTVQSNGRFSGTYT